MELSVEGPAGATRAFSYSGGKPFDAALPAVVFVHGALHDHGVWTLLARWFAHHGHAVLAPDLPGHGRSEGPPLTTVEALAGWLLALLDAARLGPVALVGHSMGSLIALEAAARAPDRVHHLAMLATAYPMRVSEALLATAAETPLLAIDRVNAFSHASTAAKPSFPGPGSWLHGSNRALMRRVQAGHPEGNLFLVDFTVCNAYAGGFEAARQVTCPVTLLLGKHDRMTQPGDATALATALRANVVRLDAGHALMTEAPDPVLGVLRRALA